MRIEPDEGRLSPGSFFGFRHGSEKLEEMFYTCYLESMVHSIADPDQVKAASVFLMADVSAYQCADAGGIDVRNFAEIDDENTRAIRTHLGLEIE